MCVYSQLLPHKNNNATTEDTKFVIILFVVDVEHFYKQISTTLHSQIEIQCRTSIVLEVEVVGNLYLLSAVLDEKSRTISDGFWAHMLCKTERCKCCLQRDCQMCTLCQISSDILHKLFCNEEVTFCDYFCGCIISIR